MTTTGDGEGVRVVIEFRTGDDQRVTGWVHAETETPPLAFFGWLELLGILEARAGALPAREADDPARSRSTDQPASLAGSHPQSHTKGRRQ